jgi:hypothetical protein
LLADVARQVARVYVQQGERGEDETLATIRKAFETEMDAPANPGSINPIS